LAQAQTEVEKGQTSQGPAITIRDDEIRQTLEDAS